MIMKLLLALVLVIQFSYLNAQDTKDCPDHCTCSRNVMDCRNQLLAALPPQNFMAKDEIDSVYMDDNKLTELTQIPEVKGVVRFSFANNQIAKLSYDTFDNLDDVTYLKLSYNNLTTIADDIFEWNPLKLQILYLDNNQIEFIQHFLFYDLEELTEIYLNDNNITFIHPHAFVQLKKLRRLRLDNNHLHMFNPKWVAHFESHQFDVLRFDSNPYSCDCDSKDVIEWLNDDKDKDSKSMWFKTFEDNNNLNCTQPPELINQRIKTIDLTTTDFKSDKPKIAQISQNTTIKKNQDILLQCVLAKDIYPIPSISWLAPNKDTYKLQNAENFEGIQVHQNGSLRISDVDDKDMGDYTCSAVNSQGTHSAVMNLIVLDGNFKADKDEEPDIKVATQTVGPDVNVVAHPNACPEHCQCVSLNIDCSDDGTIKIDHIPEDIPKEALSINMALNSIRELKANQFFKYKNLKELRLDNNEISTIDAGAFVGLSRLTTLTLRDNKLTGLQSNTFKPLMKLNVLVLDNNQIRELRPEMFDGLDSLSWLYVRNNIISTITPGVFNIKVFPKIKFIHLENNKLTRIDETLLAEIKEFKNHVQKIFVDDNQFICDSKMEATRKALRPPNTLGEVFADGILCTSPSGVSGKYLADVEQELEGTLVLQADDYGSYDVSAAPPLHGGDSGSASGIMIGGIVLGVIITIAVLIAWRKWGKRARTMGRSYNYSEVGGDTSQETQGLTEPTYSGRDTEAFV